MDMRTQHDGSSHRPTDSRCKTMLTSTPHAPQAAAQDAQPATDSRDPVAEVSGLFKLLADPARLRILFLLRQYGELNVLALCEQLGCSQPAVSHHLGLLKQGQLITARSEGKFNYYYITSPRVETLIEAAQRADADPIAPAHAGQLPSTSLPVGNPV